MRSNVIGRVRNTHLPKTQALLPLFEAVINSIDAIEDLDGDLTDGLIEINIKRSQIPLTSSDSDKKIPHSPISSFEIQDNGIGFTDQNYKSFNEADSQYKFKKGGKGVGRFLWLKAYEKVKIDSLFKENGEYKHRSFDFSISGADGINNHKISADVDKKTNRTIIQLINLKDEFKSYIPLTCQTIAQRIIEHCLEYYVLGRMPVVILHDRERDVEIYLDSLFEELVENSIRSELSIKRLRFDLIHFHLKAQSGLSHHMSYCGNQRVVIREELGNKIPNLPSRLISDESDDEFIYAVYVSSEYLDKNINQQRTGFNIPSDQSELFGSELSWREIELAILSESKELLKEYTDSIKTKKENRIFDYINEEAPEYKHIVKNHSEELDRIPPEISDTVLDIHLYEIHKEIEIDIKQKATEKISDPLLIDPDLPIEKQLADFADFWQEYNDIGKSALAKYIVHRKYMLSIFEKALNIKDDGKYSKEEIVHSIIFPLKKSSDDIAYDDHNLWIIDEKLSYHRYLSSDIPLNRVKELESNSPSRPDLLLFFDRAIALVDEDSPYTSGIVIFEFKRPMRKDYSDDNNPIQQVFKYVEEIKTGDMIDKNGRPISIPERTPFYCYIVADMTKNLRDQAKYANLVSTPDSAGYFGYNKEVGAYIEVIDFNKVLGDSKKRNRVLFDRLNLPKQL